MKKILVIILTAVLIVSVGGVVAYAAIAAEQGNATLPDTAFVGDVFTLPSYAEGGKNAEVFVITPDGEVFVGKKVTVTQTGIYTVEYRIDDTVVKSHKVVVATRPSDMFSVNKLAQIVGKTTYSYLEETRKFGGLAFDVNSGGEIVFERTLDMTNRNKNDSLLQFVIMPTKSMNRDYGQVILTLTDVEDPSNYVKVTVSAGNVDGSGLNGHMSYVRAGANGQTAGGYQQLNSRYFFNTTSIYGTPCYFSFEGNCAGLTTNYDFGLDLRYDSETKAFYVPSCVNSVPYGKLWLVADLDDANVFGANAWHGFTSGKAKLTVSFDRFVTNTGHILFNEIDGIDLSVDCIEDIEPPIITVDMNGETKAPNSFVGATYKVFDAVAKDFYDENCVVSSKVLYNDNTGNDVWYDVSVKDGQFVTDKIGKYKIVYTATDKSDNKATCELQFICTETPYEIVFGTLPADINATVFDKVTLPDVDDIKVRGGNGKLSVTRKVTAPDGTEAETENNIVTVEQIGQYNVEFIATDYFGNSQKTAVKLTVGGFSGASFVTEPVLPRVMIGGFAYALPKTRAVVCQGNQVLNADVKIFADGEELTNASYIAPIDKASVKIEYRAYEKSDTYTSFSQIIPVANSNEGKDQTAYFFNESNKITSKQNESSISFSFSEDDSLFFANTLNKASFATQFYYEKAALNFTEMTLKFVDSTNSNVSVSIKVTFTPSGFNVSFGRSAMVPLATKTDANGGYFGIGADFVKGVLRDINEKVAIANITDDNGDPFVGFNGGVYLTISFGGVKAASKIDITKINNQPLGYKNTAEDPVGDKVAPELVIDGEYTRKISLGDSLNVFSAECFDVLGQSKSVVVSVIGPDNKPLLSNMPTDKTYNVPLEKVGRYRVIYTMTDSHGNKENGGAIIMVVDSVAPTLEVSTTYKQVYRVGKTITLPKFTVSDNLDNVYCDITEQLPSSELRLLTHYANGKITSFLSKTDKTYPNSFKASDNSFILETAGKYIITVTAYDDTYNCVTKTFVLYAVD